MIILTALLLAAQPAARPRAPVRSRAAATSVKPTSDWLQGLWVAQDQAGPELEGCADWTALFFQADGQYLQGEVTGRWKLEGASLKRQPFTYAEGGGDEERPTRAGQVSRVVRVSQDKLREIGPDGKARLYLRCPKPETPVAR